MINVPDNIIAQKLLAESYLLTGNVPQALASFKILMFFCPNNQELHDIVVEMETTLFQPELWSSEQPAALDPIFIKNRKIRHIQRLTQLLPKLERHHHHLENHTKHQKKHNEKHHEKHHET